MRIQNWIACVQDRGKWNGVVQKVKLSTKGKIAPGRKRFIHVQIHHVNNRQTQAFTTTLLGRNCASAWQEKIFAQPARALNKTGFKQQVACSSFDDTSSKFAPPNQRNQEVICIRVTSRLGCAVPCAAVRLLANVSRSVWRWHTV